ncbi:hypothetical protein IFM89_029496 [Coptis chinensis]|uniref:Uncharacterized protein n=1 Tax=Coptis chinensis TaxID=261450 RepID=A0A835HZB5_9MAGN|nr:hypothetical protein IFM89_029496 [Coptis chinensis]
MLLKLHPSSSSNDATLHRTVLPGKETSTTCLSRSPSNAIASMNTHLMYPTQAMEGKEEEEEERKTKENLQTHSLTQGLKFFKKGEKNKPIYQVLECTVEDVEEVKVLVKILPIFACTIMFNCCLAQLSTFSWNKQRTMDTKVGSLKLWLKSSERGWLLLSLLDSNDPLPITFFPVALARFCFLVHRLVHLGRKNRVFAMASPWTSLAMGTTSSQFLFRSR